MARYLIPWGRDEATTYPFPTFQKEMNRLLEDFFSPSAALEARPLQGFVPKINVSEDKEKFELAAELPGIDEKDIEVTVENKILTLKGEKKVETESKEKNFHRIERASGSFMRQMQLPDNVDEHKTQASYSKGVLKLIIPKIQEPKAQAKKIEIKAS